jgi:hypothetical protein
LYSSISSFCFLFPIFLLLPSAVPQTSSTTFFHHLLPILPVPSTSSHSSILPYSLQFLPLFCLKLTYCSVSFVCLFVSCLFVNSLVVNNLSVYNLFVKFYLLTVYSLTV